MIQFVAFLIMTLIVNMIFGDKVALWFLGIVLLSMVLINDKKVLNAINSFNPNSSKSAGTTNSGHNYSGSKGKF